MEFKKYSREEFLAELGKEMPEEIDLSYLGIDDSIPFDGPEDRFLFFDKKYQILDGIVTLIESLLDKGMIKEGRMLKREYYSKRDNANRSLNNYKRKQERKRQKELRKLGVQELEESKNQFESIEPEKEKEIGGLIDSFLEPDNDIPEFDCHICESVIGEKPLDICNMRADGEIGECINVFNNDMDMQEKYNVYWSGKELLNLEEFEDECEDKETEPDSNNTAV